MSVANGSPVSAESQGSCPNMHHFRRLTSFDQRKWQLVRMAVTDGRTGGSFPTQIIEKRN